MTAAQAELETQALPLAEELAEATPECSKRGLALLTERLLELGGRVDAALSGFAGAAFDRFGALRARLRAAAGGKTDVAPDDEGETVVAAAESALKPPGRGRRAVFYLSMLSVSALAGGAVSYGLFARGLEQGTTASHAGAGMAQWQARLKLEQAGRAEVEARLAATVAADQKQLAAEQAKLAAAERRLARGAAGQPPPKAADCTLGSHDVRSTLIDCIEALNRD